MTKEELIALAKELVEEPDLSKRIKDFNLIKKSQKVFSRDDDTFASSQLEDEFNKYFSILKERESTIYEEVISQKKELISKVKSLKDSKNFKKASEEVTQIIEEFKNLGRLPKDQDDLLWNELKLALDAFNQNRKQYYLDVKEKISNNKVQKEELVKKAQEALELESIKSSTKAFEDLMEEWKKVGYAGKDDEKLWKEFNEVRQAFYKKRKSYYEEMQQTYNERIVKKEELIKKAKIILANSEFTKDEINQLKALRQAWKEVGFVGKAKDDELYKEFDSTINKYFEEMKR